MLQNVNARFIHKSKATPLVLLPGTLCDSEVFAPMLEQLATFSAVSRTILVETLKGGDTIESVAARILANAPPRFALLGFSLGGIVALAIAAAAPDRVLGLGLIDSNSRDVAIEDRPARYAEALLGSIDLERHITKTLWPRYVAPSALDNEQLRRTVADMAMRMGPAALMLQTQMGLSRPDSRSRLAALAMPALVLAGAEDALCPPPFQREMAQGLPSATLVLIPNAGHFALLENPALVSRHIASWLEGID